MRSMHSDVKGHSAIGVPVEMRSIQAVASEAPKRTLKFARRPHLDGVRAIAAIMVVLFHAKTPGFANGYAGVDIFFVLSGFLITSLLIREITSNGHVDFPKFYARRMHRLLPAAGMVLLVTAGLYRFFQDKWWVLMHRDSFSAAALYYENFNAVSVELDYFADDEPRSPVMHYWSLSIEEQFYFVYPVAFAALLWFCQHRVAYLAGAMTVIMVAVASHTIAVSALNPMQAYFSSLGRTYQLIAGALLGLYVFNRQGNVEGMRDEEALAVVPVQDVRGTMTTGVNARRMSWELLPLVPLLLLMWNIGFHTEWTPVMLGLYTCILSVALFACFEFVAVDSVWLAVLGHPQLVHIGKLSYSMYLVHMPLCVLGDLLGILPGEEFGFPRGVTVLVLTIAISTAVYYLVERPTMKLPISSRRLVLACGALFTLTLCVLLPMILDVEISPELQGLIDARAADAAGGGGDACELTCPVCPSVAVGAQHTTKTSMQSHTPMIFSAGDSYCEAWDNGLRTWAQQHQYQYQRRSSRGCMWLNVTEQWDHYGTYLKDCDRDLYKAMFKVLRAQRPFVTLLFTRSTLVRALARTKGGKHMNALDPGWLEYLEEVTRSRIQELRQYTNPIVVAPIPRPEGHTVQCVSNVQASGSEAEKAVTYNEACASAPSYDRGCPELVAMWERLGKEMGFKVLKLDFLCPNNQCPVYNKGMLTMKDKVHLSNQYGEVMTPQLMRALEEIGVDFQRQEITF